MNQFVLQQGRSKELLPFSHINEFAVKKNNTIQLNSFHEAATNSLRLYYINEGKFEWVIHHEHFVLFPGDLVLILPGHSFGGERGVLDIGTLVWLNINIEKIEPIEKFTLGKWSNIGKAEAKEIGKILFVNNMPVLSNMKEAGRILTELQQELFSQQLGYGSRVNNLLDELFILIARRLTYQQNSRRDFPQTFMKLEQALRQNLAHHWTVEEMAAIVGLGTTALTEKVKNYSGFSPLNYLINIRISEAIKMLKRPDLNVTDIALDTGFYSSQHFSTTFKKLTGYTPSEFRKKNLPSSQQE
jgi:AraC-like DNA-binding protein